jgi:hypothetical protein
MDDRILSDVCSHIYRQYPEFSGKLPHVQNQGVEQFLLTFQTVAELPNGKKLPRTLRAVVTAKGKILKVSTSH